MSKIITVSNHQLKHEKCPGCNNTVVWERTTDVMTEGYWDFDEATAWNCTCEHCQTQYVDLHGDGLIREYPADTMLCDHEYEPVFTTVTREGTIVEFKCNKCGAWTEEII